MDTRTETRSWARHWAPVPFTSGDYAARMARTAVAAAAAGLDGVLVAPGADLLWLTGYDPPAVTEHLTLLVIAPGIRPTLLVPAEDRADAEEIVCAAGADVAAWADGANPYRQASAFLGLSGTFGLSDSTWACHLLGLQEVAPAIAFRGLRRHLPTMRAVKDAGELHRLTAAGASAAAAYAEIVRLPFAGRREYEVAEDLVRLLRAHGHECVDFTVVGSGPCGADPRHEAGDRIIAPGDAVVLDFGGLVFGYGSRTTRTVSVGAARPEVARAHDVALAALRAAFDAVRPGVACEDVDRAARAVVADAGYGAWCASRTGHGIGVAIHEPPYLVAGERQPLLPGMVLSIEAAVPVPNRFGVRLADVVAVTDDGACRLTGTDHELLVVS